MSEFAVPVVRVALESDFEPLSRSLLPDVSRDQLRNRFTEHREGLRVLLVLEVGSGPVGTISYDPIPDVDGNTRRLFALDVGTEFRREGHGTRLVKHVEHIIATEGQKIVCLDVGTANSDAISLYTKLGYEIQGKPQQLQWTRWINGEQKEIVIETSHRMTKSLS